ncbi:hypothetical protein FB45DRAFT_470604 [Roridomyces roridus]|uniref:Uncharacterized protein n=1 Tax=Roridomyces roridus TaxID=1738132 RepID=A0AAD7C0I4_9AGAR|nr:hypothetical protein FB45DRAFT_470604 [Roridomyces roridus]
MRLTRSGSKALRAMKRSWLNSRRPSLGSWRTTLGSWRTTLGIWRTTLGSWPSCGVPIVLFKHHIRNGEAAVRKLQWSHEFEVVDQAIQYFNDILFARLKKDAHTTKAVGFRDIYHLTAYKPRIPAISTKDLVYWMARSLMTDLDWDLVVELLRRHRELDGPFWNLTEYDCPVPDRNDATFWLSKLPASFSAANASFLEGLPEKMGESEMDIELERLENLRSQLNRIELDVAEDPW